MTVSEAKKQFLSGVIHADGVVKSVELKTVSAILGYGVDERDAETSALMSELESGRLRGSVSALSSVAALSLEDKRRFIKMLWLAALCDGELHDKEEVMILNIADALDLDRLDVLSLLDRVTRD